VTADWHLVASWPLEIAEARKNGDLAVRFREGDMGNVCEKEVYGLNH